MTYNEGTVRMDNPMIGPEYQGRSAPKSDEFSCIGCFDPKSKFCRSCPYDLIPQCIKEAGYDLNPHFPECSGNDECSECASEDCPPSDRTEPYEGGK